MESSIASAAGWTHCGSLSGSQLMTTHGNAPTRRRYDERVRFPAIAFCACFVGCASGGSETPPADDASIDGALDVSLDAPRDVATDGPSDVAHDSPADASDAGDANADATIDPIHESLVGDDVPSPRVGMFYLVWHAPAATAMQTIASKGGTQLTIEDVIRSNGAHSYSDIYEKYGVEGDAMALYWNVRPKLGFYCIYRARPGETGWVPDCPNIETTLATHAAQLIAAGVDHVVVDGTNLTGTDRAGDLLQLRPTEVLFEEWAKLRAAGKKTPQIAVWNAVPAGATQWSKLLSLYQNPAYDGLVLHDKKTKKKVFFLVDSADARAPDPTIVAAIRSNGGKNDVETQGMWTIDRTDASIDRWAFMSWCHDGGRVTTSIVGPPKCDQPYTPVSTLGSVVAVAPSFQTGYGSLPFGAAGKLHGLTFRRQWETALGVMPDWVFISGWNEFVAQPQANPYTGDPFARSLGLERDPEGQKLFVDTWGSEFGRDIEPTEEYGSSYYDLVRSCIRVFVKNAKTSAKGCGDASEPCCDAASASDFTNVFSLRNDGAHDSLLTTSSTEKTSLVGVGWREVCSRYGTPTVFCTRGDEPSTPFGPFLAYTSAGADRVGLMRCLTGSAHFYTLDPGCEGQKVEAVLAYLATKATGEMPRRVERCHRSTTGEHFVALGAPCPTDATDEGTLGYAR